MSDKYDVERMLNRLVEDEEESSESDKAVYSWQKDRDYRDKKTDNLSVDDIISTIDTRRGKHEAVRRRARNVVPVKSDGSGHSIKQKIVYRSPQEIQEEVDKQDNVDSREYLNQMLDRMEKEIAAMESPLKPKVKISENPVNNVRNVPQKEKNVIKVRIKKKEEPENFQNSVTLNEKEDNIENDSEKNIDSQENIEEDIIQNENLQAKPEIETVQEEKYAESEETEKKDVYSENSIENYDSLDEENIKIEQELKDFSDELLSDTDDFEDAAESEPEVKEKKKGFFSRLFSKKNKSEEKSESDEEELFDFDEEEFNKKFDELSRQAEELQKDYSEEITEPEEMEEDDYFFDEEESENVEISDTAETEKIIDADEENAVITEENKPEEDLMDESELPEYDVTESTEKSDDDEKIFIESVKKDEKEIVSDKKLKQKKYMYFGILVSVFAVIGLVTVVYTAGGALLDGVRGSSVKSQINKKIYPMVVEDAGTFDDVSECSDTDIIGAAVLNILMNDDVKKYSNDSDTCTIPSADVEKSAAEIYGNDVKIKEHQNVTVNDATFYYDKVTGVYSVSAKPLIYTSKPYISKVTSNGDTYTAQVLYITDYPDWLEKKSDGQSYYNKICDYTLKRSSNKEFYVVSVKEKNVQ